MRGLAVFIATGLGVGRLPIAPATWASAVVAVLLFFVIPHVSFPAYVLLLLAVTVLALIVCGPAEQVLGHDAHPIVMDEVAGMMVTMAAVPSFGPGPPFAVALLLGFFFFRVFDILKPPPVGRAQLLPGAWGIVVDDLLAGIYANLCLQIVALVVRRL